MAAQVLSGTSNVSYTNNTGQNVRVIINFMLGTSNSPGEVSTPPDMSIGSSSTGITLSWAGVIISAPAALAMGKNVASYVGGGNALFASGGGLAMTGNGLINYKDTQRYSSLLPTELMLAPSQSFSATCRAYNIVVIPEAG